MIPLKIQLKNFLSYGPTLQAIDFGTYPFICLSGKNGHGKSALLDAMTWALWGQARKISGVLKPDAQLLRLGQSNMLVIFDFMFNGSTYRVRREFSITPRGNTYAALEFGMFQPGTTTLVPLTTKAIRGTQQTIESMLGLDFEAFINSAFLRQGQANEFSRKSPKDRKEILASILHLSQYEAMRKCALEKSKVAAHQTDGLKQVQERIQQELATKDALGKQMEARVQELASVQKEESILSERNRVLVATKTCLLEQKQKHQMLVYQHEQFVAEKKSKEEKLFATFATWRSTCRKQHGAIDQKELERAKARVAKQLAVFSEQQQTVLQLKEVYAQAREKAQATLSAVKEKHSAQLHTRATSVERLQIEENHTKKRLQELEQQEKMAQAEFNHYMRDDERLAAQLKNISVDLLHTIEKQFEKRKVCYHAWTAEFRLLETELKNVLHKKELIGGQDPSCPLCQQNLSHSRKSILSDNFVELERQLRHKIKRFTRILQDLKAVLLKQHKELELSKKRCQEHKLLQVRRENVAQELMKKKAAITELEQSKKSAQTNCDSLREKLKQAQDLLKKETAELDQKIKTDALYREHEKRCGELEAELKAVPYDKALHQKTLKELQLLQEQEQELAGHMQEASLQQQRKLEIHAYIADLRACKRNTGRIEQLIKEHGYRPEQKQTIEKDEKELAKDSEALRAKKEALLEHKGSLEQQLQQLQQREKEYTQYGKKIDEAVQTTQDYQMVAAALSKDGIQALLIEDALPEIEQEANDLLAKLSNNQAHIIIESLRDLKKGGTRETLDIKISDTVGVRPYELFSGGEAFRIDFALRIAISKLLARRAGTSLQTLIIDEGFGSQDEEGLGLLMDAIVKIQYDFAKVIVVSHLSSMKDQFPVHFFIHKGPQGSMVSVKELG